MPPTAPGYSTFSFDTSRDNAVPAFAAVVPATLLASVAHEGTGETCMASAMQSKSPLATNLPTYNMASGWTISALKSQSTGGLRSADRENATNRAGNRIMRLNPVHSMWSAI